MTAFKKLGLSDSVLKILSELDFQTPTEIQEKSIPTLLEGETDFIGLAQTGTGKTAAFGLPLIEHIDPHSKKTQALVLSPTRELGKQIADQLATFSKYLFDLNVLAVYGGEPISKQLKMLRKPQHIIIATPGRLIDLIKRKAIDLKNIRFLVLDEADEMLNMGFKDELDEILAYTPEEKYTWLFSATMPKEIKKIVNSYMDDPIEVRINSKEKVNANISHKFVLVRRNDKSEALKRFIDLSPKMRSVVFCRTRMDTQELAEELIQFGYKADAIHGDLSQGQRDKVMKRFKTNKIQLLIATDVAARGIDVNDLTHVFHYTLPDDPSYYTHRSGRTARAGKEGTSIAFTNSREMGKIRRFQKELSISFEKILIPSSDHIFLLKLNDWVDEIKDEKISEDLPQTLIDDVIYELNGFSKSQLIARLMSIQFNNSEVFTNDLNEGLSVDSGGRSGRSGRSSRDGDRRSGGGYKGKKGKKKYGRRTGGGGSSEGGGRSKKRKYGKKDGPSGKKKSGGYKGKKKK